MSDATQPVSAPPGLPYGGRKELEDSQKVTPMAGAPSAGLGGAPPVRRTPAPGEVPSLDDPSAYPDEPVTAGLAVGPGAGPESLLVGQNGPESLSLLRMVYQRFPNEDIRRLIERTELNL